MRRLALNPRSTVLAVVVFFALVCSATAQEPKLTKEEMKQFLLTAKVVKGKQNTVGITNPWRLTLNDGKTTHDGSFQSVDEHKANKQFDDGHVELNFVDSYKYNIAAYALSELLGVDDMLPMYVERKWQGNVGSLSWWLPVKMDEGQRLQKKLSAPDSDAWNKQMYRMRVFDSLVDDSDPNLTNVLIGEDWKLWRVDFSRAFRLSKDLPNTKNLTQCDRQLFEKLKTLDRNEFTQKTKNYLSKSEIDAVMARRDKIVAFLQKSIAEKGEAAVLY
jgi:hypothetical protein